MLLDNAHLQTQTNCNIEGSSFKIKASPIAFDILSSKLYSNPTLAIVRELLTNAYDSHKAVGKEDVAIKVNIPSCMESNFIIRDYGLGLCKEDVLELYTTFFDSTKSNTNDFTGCFGLGSKTPFSYTSSFSVISYYNGTKYYFVATKKDGLPHIYAIKEEPTDECNGLEIAIPTDKSNGYDIGFFQNICNYLKYIPEIQIESNLNIPREEPLWEMYGIKLYRYDQPYWNKNALGKCYIKQGQNIYEIDEFIQDGTTIDILRYFLRYAHIVVEAPIGTLHVTPSRESLSQDKENIEKVYDYLTQICANLKKALADNIASFNIPNTNFTKIYNEVMTDKYFDGHPLKVHITTFDSDSSTISCCKIDTGCYVEQISYDGVYKNSSIVQKKKSYLLLVSSNFNRKNVVKMRNTINNYDELENVNIHIVIPYGGRYNSNILHLARLLKGLAWSLNSIPEYDFDVEYQTINQFYKRYTNHKKQRENVDKIIDNIERGARYNVLRTYPHEFKKVTFEHKTHPISYLKKLYPPESTIIIYKEKEEITNRCNRHSSFREKSAIIQLFLGKIRDTSNKNFLLKHLIELNPELERQSNLYIVEVSKTLKKYFKEYTISSFDRLFSIIKETEWKTLGKKNTDLIRFLENCNDMLKWNFNEKTFEVLQKTKTYYKLQMLSSIIFKNNRHTNQLEPYEIDAIEKHIPGLITCSNRMSINVSTNLLSDKLMYLYKCYQSQPSHSFKRFNKITKTQESTYTKVLTKKQKWNILLLLKGDF